MSQIHEVEIPTRGMHCRSCETLVEMTVGEIEGVESVTARAAGNVTRVAYDPDVVSLDVIVQAIRQIGYDAQPPEA